MGKRKQSQPVGPQPVSQPTLRKSRRVGHPLYGFVNEKRDEGQGTRHCANEDCTRIRPDHGYPWTPSEGVENPMVTPGAGDPIVPDMPNVRSEEHTSELQSPCNLV